MITGKSYYEATNNIINKSIVNQVEKYGDSSLGYAGTLGYLQAAVGSMLTYVKHIHSEELAEELFQEMFGGLVKEQETEVEDDGFITVYSSKN